ncbi:minor tail protein [Microbacterium phage Sucha]|nr:minor tail protein [Microbacterium phage Sucha]
MAENSWPFYGVETNETQFSKWARVLTLTGINTGLGVTAGTGMQVRLGSGSAMVRGVYYENDATINLPVGAAPAAGTVRLDAVILKLDQTANSITVSVKAGTANSSGGALPAFTQNETVWELPIATITVAAGTAAITTAMISELRPSVGLRVIPYVTATRPTPSESQALGVNTNQKRLELWVNGGWVDLMDLALASGVLPVDHGGTGATTAAQARANLGAAASSHTHPWSQISGTPTTYPPSSHTHDMGDLSGVLPVAKGGTGANNATSARGAIGAAASVHTHTWSQISGTPATYPPSAHGHALTDANITGILPVNQGGTGVNNAKAALIALGIVVQPTAPSHKKGRVWIPGTAPD